MNRERECPGGCGRTVAHNVIACRKCWDRLPDRLRRAIQSSYRRHPRAHALAMQEAASWFAMNPPNVAR